MIPVTCSSSGKLAIVRVVGPDRPPLELEERVRGEHVELGACAGELGERLEPSREVDVVRVQDGHELGARAPAAAFFAAPSPPCGMRTSVTRSPNVCSAARDVVLGLVVADHDLERGERLRERRLDRLADEVRRVPRCDDDREPGGGGHGHAPYSYRRAGPMRTHHHDTLLRRAGRRLPGPLRQAVWRRTSGRGAAAVHWGNLRRTEPFSRNWGAERGLPVDRVYIARFLERRASDIRGEVMEIHDSLYTTRYGGDRVTRAHVLDLDASNPAATIIGDLAAADTLAPESLDCVVLTQTLQFVADAEAAIANVYRALAPGGVLLLTVPSISQLERSWDDLWRWTPIGLERFLDGVSAGGGGA